MKHLPLFLLLTCTFLQAQEDPSSPAHVYSMVEFNELGGIGALVVHDEGGLRVNGFVPDSPAEKAGLKKDDLIVQVDGQLLEKIKPEEQVDFLRGKKDTEVTLLVRRPDPKSELKIVVKRSALRYFMHGLENGSLKPDERVLVQINDFSEGKTWEVKWVVPETRLAAVSSWDGTVEPKFSTMQAVDAARKYLKAQGRDDRLPVRSVGLEAPLQFKADDHFYFYFINFENPGSEPTLGDADVVVLLDGSIVEPIKGPVKHEN